MPTLSRAASNEAKGKQLDPNFVTGLVDAEGSFMVFIKLNSDNSVKLVRQIQLSFEISLHIKDIELLEIFVEYISCGVVRKSNTRGIAEWIITKSEDLNKKLIPFLTKYTLFYIIYIKKKL